MNSITKIMIADDHALFADGLEQIVDSLKGFTVVGKATDGKMLMQKLNTVVPDIILMDINMPIKNGFETLPINVARDMLNKSVCLLNAASGELSKRHKQHINKFIKDLNHG